MLSHEDYTVGWICALPLEMTAAKAMLDETHSNLSQPATDDNTYTLGKINAHNVVITCLPSYGTTPAAVVVSNMKSTFSGMRFGLMVGIGGGVPRNSADLRLGDVVVSKPTGRYSGVVQYDHGKAISGGQFQLSGALNQPPQVLLTSIAQLQADHMGGKKHSIAKVLSETQEQIHDTNDKFTCPGQEQDELFHSTYDHIEFEDTCVKCDREQLVHREQRASKEPKIHYGLIASGNQVMKDGRTRDCLAQEHGILCFEMEAAGLMNQLPCLVIRGICDYSDSHKNKKWQGYAALTAAAYGKILLSIVPMAFPANSERARTEMTGKEKECLNNLFLTDPADDKNALKRRKGDRAPGTCEWILETNELNKWLGSARDTDCNENILWLYGNPGTGKSTMAISMVEKLPNQSPFVYGDKTLAYFFCDSSSEDRRTVTAILRGLLYQLIKQRQELMKFLLSRYERQKEKLFTSFDALWATLIEMGDDIASGEKYCIIDALDECDRESQQILLTQIAQSFSKHDSNGWHPSIHILITGRPYPEIREHLTEFNCKDLASYQKVKKDLQVFIREKVKELRQKKTYTEKVALEVSQILEEKAEGTFMWVGIACGELGNVRSRDAVKTLRNLPRGLHSLYRELLDTALKHDERDNQTIIQMLSFVAISRRPLSVAELSEACQLYRDEDEENRLRFTQEDIEMCRLMIIVQDGIVRLLHKSVRDFLVGYKKINDLKAHATLANRCISHVLQSCRSMKDMENWGRENVFLNFARNVFLHYAVLHWPDHAAFARTEFFVTREHECFFQLESDEREKWLKMYNSTGGYSRIPKDFSIFHVAAKWGISCLVHFGLANMTKMAEPSNPCPSSKGFDNADFMTRRGGTPLEVAVEAGQIDVIAVFLEKAMPGTIIHYGVPIAEALVENAKEMMELLLDQGGDQIKITEDMVKAAAS
ncbi:Pfs, NACHT, and ankyrin domain protein, partial [Elaphomyces granulatus]